MSFQEKVKTPFLPPPLRSKGGFRALPPKQIPSSSQAVILIQIGVGLEVF
jgi:hypothetical protein